MNIIPLPNYYKQNQGYFIIRKDSTINITNEFTTSKNSLINFINLKTNITLRESLNANINFLINVELNDEGYIIDINENEITIHAKTDKGAFYAIESLKQLSFIKDNNLCFYSYYIEDNPRFNYRSFMLDVARHFFKKEIIFELIDQLSALKFNYLHLHLSDDQGFRIKIDQYPLLSKIGSVNKHTKGFYTKEDIKEIVEYAKSKYIEVIPEIDLPGHTTAIIASYPEFSCNKETIEVENNYGIMNNTLCMGSSEVYDFVFNLLDEIMELFPSKFIHIGADEVRYKYIKKCKTCKGFMKKQNIKNYKDLLRNFINNISSYIREHNKIPVAWNDVLNNNSNYNIILQHWTPFKKKQTIKEINDGRFAVISNFFYYYLNYPYSMTPIGKTYNFNPILKGVINKDNIIGVEATIWTEYIDNKYLLFEHLFPRINAISETAWTYMDNKNYSNFLNRLDSYLKSNNIIFYKNYKDNENIISRLFKTFKWIKNNTLKNKK